MTLLAEVEKWIADDPDPATAQTLREAVARNDLEFLQSCFSGFLEFGTAGLRGPLGPGPSRMNRAVVSRAALGLAAFMKTRGLDSIVVGYDARHGSRQFAEDTCELMQGAGITAHLMPRELPTPVLAYAVKALAVNAGVMVTASHNPPQDNGYKVYLGGTVDGVKYDGSQIISPVDSLISMEIDQVDSVMSAPREKNWKIVSEEVINSYISRTLAALGHRSSDLKVIHTSLHGVGDEVFVATVSAAGFTNVITVAEQAKPDPDFPTVNFPNPEEKGAIDLAIEYAVKHNSELVIANDPDADRCGAAFFDRRLNAWRMLRGDEVGSILGEIIARESKPDTILANSIVSSSLLAKIAKRHNVKFAETLTGFKYLAKIPGLTYGYEEALGYCVDSETVNDKDGISAGLKLMMIAHDLKSSHQDLNDLLDEIAITYGVHLTEQISIRVDDLSLVTKVMQHFRNHPLKEVAGLPVIRHDDLLIGSNLPPTDGLRFYTDQARIILRPSGTEPKLKCYLEIALPPREDLASARAEAESMMKLLSNEIRSLILSAEK